MQAGPTRVGGALAHHVASKLATCNWIPLLLARAAGRALRSPAWLGVVGCLLLAGCAGYQLGTGTTQKFSTLFIAPVTSNALIPQAQVLVTTQLREALIRDGRVTLVNSPQAADAVLQVTLTGYDRIVSVARPDDTGLARRFKVTLRAQATLTDNRTKQVYFAQRPLSVERGVFTDSGLVPADYQGLSLLAELLASETTHAVLDTW